MQSAGQAVPQVDFCPGFIKICAYFPRPAESGSSMYGGSTPGRPDRNWVHRAVQRVQRLRWPGRPATDLWPVRPRNHPFVRQQRLPLSPGSHRPWRRLLV